MKRSFSLLEAAMCGLIGSAITLVVLTPEPRTIAESKPDLSNIVLQVDLRPIPVRDEVVNVWPRPAPNECAPEAVQPSELAPPLWMYNTELPTLQVDPPRSGLTKL